MKTTFSCAIYWKSILVMSGLLCLLLSTVAVAGELVDNGDGTVTDTATNLMWAKAGVPDNTPVMWEDAKSMAASYSGGGKGGWRLPTKDELVMLYNHMQSGSSPFVVRIPKGLPPWTVTKCRYDTENKFVDMFTGEVSCHRIKTVYSLVWPVRSAN